MIVYENECLGCTSMGMHCKGKSCPYREVPHYYCDECGECLDDIYIYDYQGEELCEECLLAKCRRE